MPEDHLESVLYLLVGGTCVGLDQGRKSLGLLAEPLLVAGSGDSAGGAAIQGWASGVIGDFLVASGTDTVRRKGEGGVAYSYAHSRDSRAYSP